MAVHQDPNLDDGSSNRSSSFQRTVILRDWWLIKCSKEFKGKRFGVAGNESEASVVEKRAMRVFTSSPIIKAFDVFTLEASDGICITLQGFLNKKRVLESGFIPEICRDFIFGFPPGWEQICNNCFRGGSFGSDIKTVHIVIDKACSPILSPCKNNQRNLEDSVAESRDKSTVTKTNTAENKDEDGCSGGSRAIDKKTAGRKSPRRQSNSGGKLESSKVQNTIHDGDYGSEDLGKAKSSDVEKDECEATDNEVIFPEDQCGRKHTGADNVDKLTSKSAGGESLTLEQQKDKLKEIGAALRSLFKDVDKSSKPGKKGKSKKSEKTLKSNRNVVEPMIHSGSKVNEAEETMSWVKTRRKIEFDLEVTPDKKPKKQKTSVDSTGSLEQKRSRSGRLLVSPLEFWRNQIPVYDTGRNLIQVNDGHKTNSTPSKGKGSASRKARR